MEPNSDKIITSTFNPNNINYINNRNTSTNQPKLINSNYYKSKSNNKNANKLILNSKKKNNLLKNLNNKLTNQINSNSETKEIFKKQIQFLINSQNNTDKTSKICNKTKKICNIKYWKKCTNDCFNYLSYLVDIEINSTAYMLKILTNSLMKSNPSQNNSIKLEFVVDSDQELTGDWSIDKYLISIKKPDDISFNLYENILIMGFGPSASGKTYWVGNILEMLKNNSTINDKIPDYIMSIDGGNYREFSWVYQEIKNIAIQNSNTAGLDSLVKGTGDMIFSSSIIKKKVLEYLKIQNQKRNIYFGYYVPETLGICTTSKMPGVSCYNKVLKYLGLIDNKDNWIGLMIYQHLNKKINNTRIEDKCPFNDEYKCVGCFESGSTREIQEGKKYSNKAYYWTLDVGFYQMLKAPLGRFLIHNSGGHKYNNNKISKSIIFEFQSKGTRGYSFHSFSKKQFSINQNYNSIDKLNQSYNCKYIPIDHETFMKFNKYTDYTNFNLTLQEYLNYPLNS